MSNVKLTDYSIKVKQVIAENIEQFLYSAGECVRNQVVSNTPVDTGQLKNSWEYVVDTDNNSVTIGSPLQNAIWNEFGTGQYALNGDGRQTPWKYKDRKGNWHTTKGKKPKRSLYRAFNSKKKVIQKMAEEIIGGS